MPLETELEMIVRRKQEQVKQLDLREKSLDKSISGLQDEMDSLMEKKQKLEAEVSTLQARSVKIKDEIALEYKERDAQHFDLSQKLADKEDSLLKLSEGLKQKESALTSQEVEFIAKTSDIKAGLSDLLDDISEKIAELKKAL